MTRRAKRGFTLTEVMIASLIFLMISMTFSGALLTALRAQYMAAEHYRATCIARNRVQRARTMEYANIPTLRETLVKVDDVGEVDQNGRFQRSTIVSNLNNYTTEVCVHVYFPKPLGGLSDAPVEVKSQVAYGM